MNTPVTQQSSTIHHSCLVHANIPSVICFLRLFQNLNKKSEALSTVEERLKHATVELPKVQMDLEAKKGECQVCVRLLHA